MEKLYYSFEDFSKDVRHIYRECNIKGWRFDCIVGIPRGGVIPAVQLSHMFKTKFATLGITTRDNAATQLNMGDIVGFVDKINQGQKLLFIDDILDSGKTLNILVEQLRKNGVREKYRIATLFHNPHNAFLLTPDIHCRIIDRSNDQRWIDFWWENDSVS
jgi:hypoxanthine phosphoribosyltransferase